MGTFQTHPDTSGWARGKVTKIPSTTGVGEGKKTENVT